MGLTAQGQHLVGRVAGWQAELAAVQARIAPRFRRPEVRARAGRSLAALLGPVARRNGWRLAEQAGERAPDGAQRLLRTARWETDAVRDDLRADVVERLGNPGAVLVVDETGFLKKGAESVGVARQYSGTAGRVEDCQIGVFLADASPAGRAFLDRALSLPKAWAEDAPRRQAAGVPAEVGFATKGGPARAMLERAFAAGVPAAWVTGDEPDGNDGGLRRRSERQRRPSALAAARSHPVWAAVDGAPAQARAEDLVATVPAGGWRRIDVGAGSKGPRVSDGACGRLPCRTADGWAQWLLIRRSVARPAEPAFSRADGRAGTTVAELGRAAGTRWVIEEGVERAKGEVGLGQYEVRSWAGWHRHITLCLLAHAFLEVRRAAATADAGKGGAATT